MMVIGILVIYYFLNVNDLRVVLFGVLVLLYIEHE
jgi:hypothetical protein